MSQDDLYGLIEMTLVFGLILGFAVHELWSLRRARQRDQQAEREAGKPPR